MALGTDFEEQLDEFNRIRDMVINDTRRQICYDLAIYDDMRLEVSEYAGLTLTVRDTILDRVGTIGLTEVHPMYNEVAILILDNDSEFYCRKFISYNILHTYKHSDYNIHTCMYV